MVWLRTNDLFRIIRATRGPRYCPQVSANAVTFSVMECHASWNSVWLDWLPTGMHALCFPLSNNYEAIKGIALSFTETLFSAFAFNKGEKPYK